MEENNLTIQNELSNEDIKKLIYTIIRCGSIYEPHRTR